MSTVLPINAAAPDRDPHLLDKLIGEAMPDMAPFLLGRFRLAADPKDETIACPALFEPGCFDELISRVSHDFPGADRRAVVSMWSLHYFSLLSITPVALWRRTQRILPLELKAMSVVVSRSTGLPVAFVVPSAGETIPGLTVFEALEPMMRTHMAPAVGFLSPRYKLSPRLLWCNAGGYIDWTLRQMPGSDGKHPGLELFTEPVVASGARNPFFGLITPVPDPKNPATEVSRRKVCCLRYGLPGVGGCGAICPLPGGRH